MVCNMLDIKKLQRVFEVKTRLASQYQVTDELNTSHYHVTTDPLLNFRAAGTRYPQAVPATVSAVSGGREANRRLPGAPIGTYRPTLIPGLLPRIERVGSSISE